MNRIEFERVTLDNGLRVLVHPDRSVPKAAVNLLYEVGSRDENEGRTGLAHLFEHLMFGGSAHIPDYDTHVQKAGGECNAFTSNDLTNYYISLPANQLETAFWLESDRMFSLDFSQRSLDVQKSVVCEEFKQRYLSQPYGDAYLHVRPLHYTVHPYKWMTIGQNLEQIEAVTLDEIKDFFFRFYAPNNAILTVAGDVDPESVFRLAEKWFGPIPNREVRRPHRPNEPKQTEAKQISLERPVPHTAVYRAYHMPARTSPEYYAADVMVDILGGGKSSRLYREMVKEKQVAASVSAFSWELMDNGMFSVDGQVAEGKTPEEYLEVLNQTILQMDSVTDAELNRVKNKVEADDAYTKARITDRALYLAIAELLGDADLINTATERYRQVTKEQVLEAVENLLPITNSSTLLYRSQA